MSQEEYDKIDISKYLVRLEETGCPVTNIVMVSLQLAEEIKNILNGKEKLRAKNDQFPILETSTAHSAEILMWAISLLSAAWTVWCFTAKTNNPKYQNDPLHPEASENTRIALPYIRPSIIDAISKGKEIGTRETCDDKDSFRPESGPAWLDLRKE